MIVHVNNKEVETKATTLAELAEQLEVAAQGVAIAIGSRMIPRADWNTTPLYPGTDIIIIKAACGG